MNHTATLDGMEVIDRVTAYAAKPEAAPDPKLRIGRNCLAFSESEDRAHEIITSLVQDLFKKYNQNESEFDICTDAIGNLFVTLYGADRSKTVLSGSHADSVPNGGKFDGMAGVASAIVLLETILRSGQTPACNYTLVVWRCEESSMLGLACVGSLLAAGLLTRKRLNELMYKNTTLRDHIIDKHGESAWTAIEDESEHPLIQKKSIRLGNNAPSQIIAIDELHPEQSDVLTKLGADVGIITAIGGARRETFEITDIPTSALKINQENPHRQFNFQFLGAPAHTGGAPPNQSEDIEEGKICYRKDALIGAATFANELSIRGQKLGITSQMQFVHCSGDGNGFTTVTPEQTMGIIVEEKYADVVDGIVQELIQDLETRKQIKTKVTNGQVKEGKHSIVGKNVFLKSLQIPIATERIVRTMVGQQGGTGEVRYTVTDFSISEKGLKTKLDLRHINPDAAKEMREKLDEELRMISAQTGIPFLEHKKFVSETDCVKLSKDIAIAKQQLASRMGLIAVLMASMAGHDIRSIALAGSQEETSGTFARDNGISHSKDENLEPKDLENAIRLSHAFLLNKLQINLK